MYLSPLCICLLCVSVSSVYVLSVYLSVCVSVRLLCVSVCLSVSVSSVYLSVCISVFCVCVKAGYRPEHEPKQVSFASQEPVAIRRSFRKAIKKALGFNELSSSKNQGALEQGFVMPTKSVLHFTSTHTHTHTTYTHSCSHLTHVPSITAVSGV